MATHHDHPHVVDGVRSGSGFQGWGQPFGAIANTLAVEGFTNRHDRVTWYPMLAREACEAAQ